MSEAFQGGLHGILHLPCRLVHHVALRSLKSLSRPGHAFLGKLWKRRFSKRPGDSFRFCLATFRGRMQNQIGLTLNPFDHRRFLRLKGGGGLGDTLLSESRKGEISKALLNLVDLRLQSLEAGTQNKLELVFGLLNKLLLPSLDFHYGSGCSLLDAGRGCRHTKAFGGLLKLHLKSFESRASDPLHLLFDFFVSLCLLTVKFQRGPSGALLGDAGQRSLSKLLSALLEFLNEALAEAFGGLGNLGLEAFQGRSDSLLNALLDLLV